MIKINTITTKCKCGRELALQRIAYNDDIRLGYVLEEGSEKDEKWANKLNLFNRTFYRLCGCGEEYRG